MAAVVAAVAAVVVVVTAVATASLSPKKKKTKKKKKRKCFRFLKETGKLGNLSPNPSDPICADRFASYCVIRVIQSMAVIIETCCGTPGCSQ